MTNHCKNLRDKITPLFLLTPLLVLGADFPQARAQAAGAASDPSQPAPAAASPATLTTPALPPGHPDVSALGNASGQMPACPGASGAASPPPLSWTTPAGWVEVPAAAMRVASFKITGTGGRTADVSIVPLPGMAGGDMANVNRWRGQTGLQPAPADVLQNSAQKIQAGGQTAQLYDLGGASSRILGVIQHRNGTAWFYKMTGDPDLVEQQKPAFIAFLQSLSFSPAAAQALLPAGSPAPAPAANVCPVFHPGTN